MVGHFTDSRRRARVPGAASAPKARGPRHQLPRPLPAHQGQAAAPRPAGLGDRRGADRPPAANCTSSTARTTRPTTTRHADAGLPRDPRRRPAHRARARRRHVLLRREQADRPRRRRVLRQRDQRDARCRVGLDLRPDRRGREVPDRVLGARRGEAAADAQAQVARDAHRPRHRRRVRHRQGDRDAPRRRGRRASSSPTSTSRRPSRGGRDRRHRRRHRRRRERHRRRRDRAGDRSDAVLAFGGLDLVVNNAGVSLSKPLLETTEKDWDLQHDVMAKGSFLVSKAAAPVLIEQGMGGDIVYISSKNSVFAGPNNIAYSATKADQAHQVRLLAVELGEHGIKVNGINPDGVVRGSGIFAERLGRQPRQDLRHRGAGPRQVLRAAHDPEARGAARERRERRLAVLTGPTSRTPPACTSPSTRASPRPSCGSDDRRTPSRSEHATSGSVAAVDLGATSGRVMLGHVGQDEVRLTTSRGSRTAPSPCTSDATAGRPALERPRAVPAGDRGAARVRSPSTPRSPASASTPGRSTTGCSATAGCSALPSHYRDERHRGGVVAVHDRDGRRRAVRPERPAAPAVQHPVPVGRRPVAAARADACAARARPARRTGSPGSRRAERTNASTTGP